MNELITSIDSISAIFVKCALGTLLFVAARELLGSAIGVKRESRRPNTPIATTWTAGSPCPPIVKVLDSSTRAEQEATQEIVECGNCHLEITAPPTPMHIGDPAACTAKLMHAAGSPMCI